MANPKQLIVEGEDDRAVIIHLMRCHIPGWPEDKESAPVYIDVGRSADQILDPVFIGVKLKQSALKALGLIIDADNNFVGRWQRVKQLLSSHFPSLPTEMPKTGLIVSNHDGLRLGVWLMPDCGSNGMMETFLKFLVPETTDAQVLWQHAENSFEEARTKGSPCRSAHADKARIHTWLAWQDPPGERLGLALRRRILDPKSQHATPFVTWFKTLYDL
jgi:hypothetical protein